MPQGALSTNTTGFPTGNGVPGERKLDVSSQVMLLAPYEYPLIGFLTNIGKVPTGTGSLTYQGQSKKKRAVTDPKFYVFEDMYGASYEALATGPAAIATSITVVDATIYAPGDIILLVDPAGSIADEQILVTAATGTTLTVTRGYDAANAGTGLNFSGGAAQMFLLGSASAEGATSRTAVSTTKTKVFNYTQIFRDSFEVTGTLNSTELYTGDQLQYQNHKKGVEHALRIERSFWFGKAYENTASATPVRTTGGIIEAIEAAGSGAFIQDEANSVLTEDEWNTFLAGAFGYGNIEKMMFASGTLLSAVSGFARGALRVAPKDKTFGIEVSQYLSPHGTVDFIRNPLFRNKYSGHGALLDIDTIEYVFLKGRDTTLRQNIQANDADTRKDEFMTECGLGRYNLQKNALLKNVAG